MSDVLASKRTPLTVESMLEILHEQHAIEYDGQLVTTEPARKISEAYGGLRHQVPGHHRPAGRGLRKCRELRISNLKPKRIVQVHRGDIVSYYCE
jgi:hypothetical protein